MLFSTARQVQQRIVYLEYFSAAPGWLTGPGGLSPSLSHAQSPGFTETWPQSQPLVSLQLQLLYGFSVCCPTPAPAGSVSAASLWPH